MSASSPTPPATPRGLYVHIPFCRRKCAYCDFVSGPHPQSFRAVYIGALERELRCRLPGFPGPVETVYVGGGSPSSLQQEEWERLFAVLMRHVPWGSVTECTVEMNPADVTTNKLAALDAVATRISVGAQTFQPALRRRLGRSPTAPDSIVTAAALIRGRFNLNIDLIHSVPGQTEALLTDDLQRVVCLGPDHVSAYALTLEEGTPLYGQVMRGEVTMPAEEFQARALALVRADLAVVGLRQYEISNFALPGRECRHNTAVWAGGDYLGIGVGACSHAGGERTRNEADVHLYLEKIQSQGEAVAERERLDPRRHAGELAMLNLRTRTGIAVSDFEARTGYDPLQVFQDAIRENVAVGLLEVTPEHIRLTERGLDLADRVMIDFLA